MCDNISQRNVQRKCDKVLVKTSCTFTSRAQRIAHGIRFLSATFSADEAVSFMLRKNTRPLYIPAINSHFDRIAAIQVPDAFSK